MMREKIKYLIKICIMFMECVSWFTAVIFGVWLLPQFFDYYTGKLEWLLRILLPIGVLSWGILSINKIMYSELETKNKPKTK